MFADNVAHNLCCQIRADDNSSPCTFTTRKSVTYTFTTLPLKVSRIDGASVIIILCFHVLIASHILLVLDTVIIFSENRCLKR